MARLPDGRTIEEAYQLDVKGYRSDGNDWRLGKGRPPKHRISSEALYEAYKGLWEQWVEANPSLLEELRREAHRHDNRLSDCFSHGRPINQARALAEILNESP